jgi:hypothetical protein
MIVKPMLGQEFRIRVYNDRKARARAKSRDNEKSQILGLGLHIDTI